MVEERRLQGRSGWETDCTGCSERKSEALGLSKCIFISPRTNVGQSCSGMEENRVSKSSSKSPICPGG